MTEQAAVGLELANPHRVLRGFVGASALNTRPLELQSHVYRKMTLQYLGISQPFHAYITLSLWRRRIILYRSVTILSAPSRNYRRIVA